MKRLSILAIALATLGTVAVAQTTKVTKKPLHCAVMADHTIDVAKATKDKMFADYKGRRYFFCCGGCKPTFLKNPAKYAKADSIPTPAKKK